MTMIPLTPGGLTRANTGMSVLQPQSSSAMSVPEFYRILAQSSTPSEQDSNSSLLLGPSMSSPFRNPSSVPKGESDGASGRTSSVTPSLAAARGILRSPRGSGYITTHAPGARSASDPLAQQGRDHMPATVSSAASSEGSSIRSSARRLLGARPLSTLVRVESSDLGARETSDGGSPGGISLRERERQEHSYEAGLANISWLNAI